MGKKGKMEMETEGFEEREVRFPNMLTHKHTLSHTRKHTNKQTVTSPLGSNVNKENWK